jgi:hypothetical protein
METASTPTTRRNILQTGGGMLAALTAIGFAGKVLAQEASPVAGEGLGQYVVIRTRTVKPEKNYEDLIAINTDEFLPIISAIDGFVAYTVIYSDETRAWTAISVYTDKAGADASTKAAADFITSSTINDYWVDPTPVVVDGLIIVEKR